MKIQRRLGWVRSGGSVRKVGTVKGSLYGPGGLGWIDTAVQAAAAIAASKGSSSSVPAVGSVAGSLFGPSGGPTGPGGGMPMNMPIDVSPPMTVSPAIQTQVSPQISPVMTMQQDSPGAQVTAAPRMTGGAGQSAATGGAPGSSPVARDTPAGFPSTFADPFGPSTFPTVQTPGRYNNLIIAGIVAVTVLGAITLLGKRRGSGNRKALPAPR